MEMEKINENTMRVTLGKEDLAERGISILDLIGNQHDVEDFSIVFWMKLILTMSFVITGQ